MISERINTGYGKITLRCGYSQRQIFLYLEQFSRSRTTLQSGEEWHECRPIARKLHWTLTILLLI